MLNWDECRRDRLVACLVLIGLAAALWAGVAGQRTTATAAGELRALRAQAAVLDARREAITAARWAEMDRLLTDGLDATSPLTPSLSHEDSVELGRLRQRIGEIEDAARDASWQR